MRWPPLVESHQRVSQKRRKAQVTRWTYTGNGDNVSAGDIHALHYARVTCASKPETPFDRGAVTPRGRGWLSLYRSGKLKSSVRVTSTPSEHKGIFPKI